MNQRLLRRGENQDAWSRIKGHAVTFIFLYGALGVAFDLKNPATWMSWKFHVTALLILGIHAWGHTEEHFNPRKD